MIEMSKELALNRQELSDLKKDNHEIKELLLRLIEEKLDSNKASK